MDENRLYRTIRNLDGKTVQIGSIESIKSNLVALDPVKSYCHQVVLDQLNKTISAMRKNKIGQAKIKLSVKTKKCINKAIADPFKKLSITPNKASIQFSRKLNTSQKKTFISSGFKISRDGKTAYKNRVTTLDGIECYCEETAMNTLGAVANDDVYQIITDMVTDMIENSKDLVWRKPWKSMESYGLPATNFASKKPYRGINSFLLNFLIPFQRQKEWDNPYFLTFNQVKQKGGKVKEGAKGYFVTYFQMIYKLDGKRITDKQYFKYFAQCAKGPVTENGINVCENLDEFPVLRYYKVFNGEDIEGIDFKLKKKPKKKQTEKIEAAENIIRSYPTPKPKFSHKKPEAFYIPGLDEVNMPVPESFESLPKYYCTLFHEYIHSTGHKKRLDRLKPGGMKTKNYAFEELIAELGATFLCGESGILYHTINNSAAYLEHWKSNLLAIMKKDNKFFFRASSKAQEAADFILQPDSKGVPKYLKRSLANSKKKKDRPTVKRPKKAPTKKTSTLNGIEEESNERWGFLDSITQDETDSQAETNSSMGFKTADDIMNTNFETLPFNGVWGEFMQDPGTNLKLIIYGKPKNGKTSFSFQFADYISGFGDVLYVLADQGIGQATKKLIKDMKVDGNPGMFFDAFRSLNELRKALDTGKFKFVFIDLINNFRIRASEMESFMHQYPNIGFILVMESTKAGDFRGEQTWTHIVDSIVNVENFVASNTGRYGSGTYTWPKPEVEVEAA